MDHKFQRCVVQYRQLLGDAEARRPFAILPILRHARPMILPDPRTSVGGGTLVFLSLPRLLHQRLRHRGNNRQQLGCGEAAGMP